VKALLELKEKFKAATGLDWKPDIKLPSAAPSTPSTGAADIDGKIAVQGDKVRQLKGDKAPKVFNFTFYIYVRIIILDSVLNQDQVDAAVKALLALKAEYKAATGKDWKPGAAPAAAPVQAKAAAPSSAASAADINAQITEQGNKVRDLKSQKATKVNLTNFYFYCFVIYKMVEKNDIVFNFSQDVIDTAVKTLLELKANFKNVSGQDWKPGVQVAAAAPAPAQAKPVPTGATSSADINAQIIEQGNKVRDLKSQKAAKVKLTYWL
jgi:bifunctional glutamyl/prolyl-tRNA synthetase